MAILVKTAVPPHTTMTVSATASGSASCSFPRPVEVIGARSTLEDQMVDDASTVQS